MAIHIGRRKFIAAIGTAAVAWPLAANAQQASKVSTVGYLGANTASIDLHRIPRFVQRLRELGWVEGRTVSVEYRWSEGRSERYAEVVTEYLVRKVDIIFTNTGLAALVAKQATSITPIIFITSDPLGIGLVASLTRPGGNVTGLSLQGTDTAGKRLELFHEVIPALSRLAVLANSSSPLVTLEMSEIDAAARKLGIESTKFEIRRVEDITTAIEAMKGRADALYVALDPLTTANAVRINTLALGARLPTMHGFRELVEAGGLTSYGPNIPDLFRRAADFVDKILRGAKPADLPVEQPTKFDFVINLTTAKALSLAIPEAILLRADEVIE